MLILIIIGFVGLFTQGSWVPKLVDKIVAYQPAPAVVEVEKIIGPKLGTYDWCIANGGEDIVQDFNSPKDCNLNHRIFTHLAAISPTSAKVTLAKMQRRKHGSHPLHWREQPSFPPDKNVDSADISRSAAAHFGGNFAICATNAIKIANPVQC